MSTILFDAETGRLRLDRPAFDTLVGWATDRRADGADELRAAGLVGDDGEPAAAISDGVDAIVDPVCRLTLRVQDATGRRETHQGWIDGTTASLLLASATGDDLCELVSMHPTFLPEAIARIVRLGPRPQPAEAVPLRVAPAIIEDLSGAEPRRRAAAAERLLAAASGETGRSAARALASGIQRRWEAIMTWNPAPGAPDRRGLHVLDGPAGLWLIEPAGGGFLASPSTARVVWRLLTKLLPRDDELDARHRPGGRARPGLDI